MNIWENIKTTFNNLTDSVSGIFKDVLPVELVDFFQNLFEMLGDVLGMIFSLLTFLPDKINVIIFPYLTILLFLYGYKMIRKNTL